MLIRPPERRVAPALAPGMVSGALVAFALPPSAPLGALAASVDVGIGVAAALTEVRVGTDTSGGESNPFVTRFEIALQPTRHGTLSASTTMDRRIEPIARSKFLVNAVILCGVVCCIGSLAALLRNKPQSYLSTAVEGMLSRSVPIVRRASLPMQKLRFPREESKGVELAVGLVTMFPFAIA